MAKISYIAPAVKPEDLVVCTALDSDNYPALYSERVNSILGSIEDEKHRVQIRNTLGSFESGSDGKLAQSSAYKLVSNSQVWQRK